MRFCANLPLSFLLAGSVLAGASARPGDDRGFKRLFNGKDLTGWVKIGTGEWSAKDGELKCDGSGSGWLRSEKMYENFIVRLEYQISAKGNSGVFIHAPEQGRSSRLGFEIQIMDDAGKPADKNSTGSLYDIIQPKKNANKPAGEWNQEEITCDGPHIVVNLNGEKILDLRTDDPEINAEQADIHKPMLRHKVGYVGLQNHNSAVKFRNLRIKVLPGGENSAKAAQ
jgi:hypothetical protein